MTTPIIATHIDRALSVANLHLALKQTLANIQIAKQAAKSSKRQGQNSNWAYWMNTIKQLRKELSLLAKWLHYKLYLANLTNVEPIEFTLRQRLTSVVHLHDLVCKNVPALQTAESMR